MEAQEYEVVVDYLATKYRMDWLQFIVVATPIAFVYDRSEREVLADVKKKMRANEIERQKNEDNIQRKI